MKESFNLPHTYENVPVKRINEHKKAYIGLFILLLLLIVALTITVGVLSNEIKEHHESQEHNKEHGHNESHEHAHNESHEHDNCHDHGDCVTSECVTFSAEMLSRMNLSADPCDDFYQYACGRFADPQNRAPHENAITSFDSLDKSVNEQIAHLFTAPGTKYRGQDSTAVEKAKKFYSVCVEDTGNERRGNIHLLKLIIDMNLWPLSSFQETLIRNQSIWNPTEWDLNEAIIKSQTFGFDALMTVGTWPDPRGNGEHILGIYSSGLMLGYPDYYSRSDWEEYYIVFMEYVLTAIYDVYNTNHTVWARKIFNLERSISRIYPTYMDLMKFYHPSSIVKVGDLQRNVSYMNLTYILNRIYNNSGRIITDDTEILVGTPQYFSGLSDIIRSLGSERNNVMATYIVWNAVLKMLNFAGNSLRILLRNFSKKTLGFSSLPIFSPEVKTQVATFQLSLPKWKNCISRTVDALGFAVGALHGEKFFNERDKDRISEALQTTVEEFVKSIENITWLSNTTRDKAKEKARAIKWQIGYPEIFNNPLILDYYYSEFSSKDFLFENVLEQKRFERKLDVGKYGKPVDRTEWLRLIKPTEVNAYYYPLFNQIYILAGILYRPSYDQKYPLSLFFGGMGSIIGHELIHGFDPNWRKFDGRGNASDWWDLESNNEYLNRSECFVKQYNESTFQGYPINGEVTLAENIADNGGIKLAYSAFKRSMRAEKMNETNYGILPGLNLTQNKQFFVSCAQLWCVNMDSSAAYWSTTGFHSPGPLRVNEVLKNTREFSEAFQCPAASPMDPTKRCSLW